MSPSYATFTKDGIVLEIIVKPASKQEKILGEYNQRLKIALRAPPIDGEANEALIEYLADLFDIPKSTIELLRGKTSKMKTLLCRMEKKKTLSCIAILSAACL